MSIWIRNARVVDPATACDRIEDIFIKDGIIEKRGRDLKGIPESGGDDVMVIDADGFIAMPGLIDLHVHLREPGQEYKETIESGSRAAAAGGFTTIFAMPNTKPATDSVETVKEIQKKAAAAGCANVMPVAAVTKGQAGMELTDLQALKEAGVTAISEDGKSVADTLLYRQAMKNAAELGITVFAHCEDKALVNGGVVNEDEVSRKNNLPGISNAVEDIIAARDILLAKETGARLHLCHCSTEGSVKMIAAAKAEGLPVTGEVCPHHFTLSTEEMDAEDANYKMNPPLRTKKDVEALRQGLKDNVMDVISTDHAPHSREEKEKGMLLAPFGIVGLETSVALTVTELVEKGYLTYMQMAEKMSYNPARIAGIDRGTLMEGKAGDVVLIDPSEEYVIDASKFYSKGKNTPFHGKKVKGRVRYTILGGKLVYCFQENRQTQSHFIKSMFQKERE